LVKVNADPGLEGVYRQHGDRLWRAVAAFAGDREVASEAVAEAFAQALRREEAIRDPLRWVWRAAFRIAAGQLKERGRFTGVLPERSYEPGESVADLLGALAQVSPKQRAAIVLHHYAGYPVKDVAGIIGSTTAAVKVHLMRGRKRLRELLEEDDG
jgi:RNA polymerase sigma-70 factor (ECF subfamily)